MTNNEKQTLISVVIPTHNRVDLLGRAIKSVQNQTYKDIEIIIVSDGSTDNTSEFVRIIKQADNRIKFYEYLPAKGANYARNLGIDKSTGEYIAFLDDDDEWLPTKLEKQLNVFLSDSSIGLVYTGKKVIYVNEKVTYIYEPFQSGDLSKKILIENNIGSTSSVIVKKDILEQTGYFDINLKAMQDKDLWIRICQITRVGYVKECLLNYYNYTNKKQISSVTQKYVEAINYFDKKYNYLFKNLSIKEINYRNYINYIALSQIAFRNNEKKICQKYCYEAIKIKFSIKALFLLLFSIFFSYKALLKLRKLK